MALLGSGTQLDPYLISTPSDLDEMRNVINAHYKLTNDIDMTSFGDWTPITSLNGGSIDGNNFKIIGLTVNNNANGASFVVRADNMVIKNLGFENGQVTSTAPFYSSIGFGTLIGCTVSNCYVTGTINTASSRGGGFVGNAGAGNTFSDCFSRVTITGTGTEVGGFVGIAQRSVFNRCYTASSVTGKTYGGFYGTRNTNASNLPVFNSCYYNTTLQPSPTVAQTSITGVTSAQMQTESTFTNWNFVDVWSIKSENNNGFPLQIVFLPKASAIIEQRDVFIPLHTISMIAEIELLIPLIKKLEATYSINPISIFAIAKLISLVRANIEVIHSINPIDVEGKRVQFKKSINDIINYINTITVDAVVVSNLTPTILDNIVNLLENGNDVTLIQYLLNDVYVKEQSTNAIIINNENSIYHIDNRNEVRIVAYTGDVARLQVKFKTFDGTPIEPTDVVLKVYKTTINSNVLIETISLTDTDKTATGEYIYDYVIPQDIDTRTVDTLVYEFSGLYNGKTTLVRGKINIRFV